MSNATIAARIAEAIAAFERGDAGATFVAESIELHEPALEAVPREVRDNLHRLSVKLIEQDLSPFEEEMLGIPHSREALAKLKLVVAGLCQ